MPYRTLIGDFAYLPAGAGPIRARLTRRFATATETFLPNTWQAIPALDGTFTLSLPVPTTGTAAYAMDLPDGATIKANIAAGSTLTLETLINAPQVAQPQNALQAAIDSALAATVGSLPSLTTTAKSTAVAAINELRTAVDGLALGASGISDGVTGTATTWSSTKISGEIGAVAPRLLPSGGTAGQVLAKTSASNYAATWQTPSAGSVAAQTIALDQTRGYDNSWAIPVAAGVQNGNANMIAMDLTGYTQCRLAFRGDTYQTNALARLAAQYAPNPFGTWSYLDGASGPSALVAQGSSYMADSGWVTIALAARTFVFLRWVGVGGDGSASYGFGTINLVVR